jgi:hypothetical protein
VPGTGNRCFSSPQGTRRASRRVQAQLNRCSPAAPATEGMLQPRDGPGAEAQGFDASAFLRKSTACPMAASAALVERSALSIMKS